MRRPRPRAALWLLALVPAAALAQRPDSLRTDTLRNDSLPRARAAATLAPVTVTALGGTLPLARVPFSVSLRTPPPGARLALPTAVDEALRGIPGLAVDDRANIALGERIAIRGFGARTQFGVRGVRVDVDDVPATMPDGQTNLTHVDPATIARSEVFRGPASALFGNAAGGAVRLSTGWPGGDALDALAEQGVGERGSVVTRLAAGGEGGPLQAALRASRFDYRGFRQRSDARTDRLGARLAVAGARDTLSVIVATAEYDAANPGSLARAQREAAPRSASPTSISFLTGERGRHRQAGMRWQRGASAWTSTVGAWGLTRDVWNPIPSRIIDLGRDAGGARAALDARLGDGERPWSIALGAELGLQRDDRRAWGNAAGRPTTLQLDQRERVVARGLHARVVAPLPAGLDAVAALRGDRVAFRVADHLVGPSDPDGSGERTMRALSPTLGLTRRWGRASVYASAATAFETPTTSELANQASGAGGLNRDLQPQRLASVEAGLRTQLGSATTIGAAAFAARLRDALMPFELASSPGRQFYRNVGRANHRGVELEAAGVAGTTAGWRMAATFLDARFAEGGTAAGQRSRHRVPGIARWSGEAALQVAAVRWLGVEGVIRGRSAMPVSDTASAKSPGHVLADLRLLPHPWTRGALVVTVGAAVENVFDSRHDASVVVNAARDRYHEPGPPRSLTVTVRAAWTSTRR